MPRVSDQWRARPARSDCLHQISNMASLSCHLSFLPNVPAELWAEGPSAPTACSPAAGVTRCLLNCAFLPTARGREERLALPACGWAWILFGSRKNPTPEKCLKMPQNPTRQVHALLACFLPYTTSRISEYNFGRAFCRNLNFVP